MRARAKRRTGTRLHHDRHRHGMSPARLVLVTVTRGGCLISTTSHRDTATIALGGEVDMKTAPDVRAELTRAIDNFERVVVDLGALIFVDSSGLAALFAARKRAAEAGRHVQLEHPTHQLKAVAAIAGLAESLGIEAD